MPSQRVVLSFSLFIINGMVQNGRTPMMSQIMRLRASLCRFAIAQIKSIYIQSTLRLCIFLQIWLPFDILLLWGERQLCDFEKYFLAFVNINFPFVIQKLKAKRNGIRVSNGFSRLSEFPFSDAVHLYIMMMTIMGTKKPANAFGIHKKLTIKSQWMANIHVYNVCVCISTLALHGAHNRAQRSNAI